MCSTVENSQPKVQQETLQAREEDMKPHCKNMPARNNTSTQQTAAVARVEPTRLSLSLARLSLRQVALGLELVPDRLLGRLARGRSFRLSLLSSRSLLLVPLLLALFLKLPARLDHLELSRVKLCGVDALGNAAKNGGAGMLALTYNKEIAGARYSCFPVVFSLC